ncbi:MAG TPA: site-specific integrase [archaeon]|nr:site-specific integrase [archaeon]
MTNYKWQKTAYRGVRCRLHPVRKFGVNQDRYFTIQYRLDGKTKEEGLGWASQGMTAKKASIYLAKLKEARLTGNGAQTLKEQREQARAQREQEKREGLTFGEFFEQTYFPLAMVNKTFKSYNRERIFFNIWIQPVIGDKPLSKISPLHLERIKKDLGDAGRAPRTIHYCLAVIRQIINLAKILNLYEGDNPVNKVKKPHVDNRRVRFLSHEEADRLLQDLAGNPQFHDMALLSLHTGMRAGEIFKLTWDCVDLERGTLFLKDTKGSRNRAVYMTEQVKNMLIERKGTGTGYVFKDRNGGKFEKTSNVFWKTIKRLKFNEGVTDTRDKVVFHTLRHTFASWLVESGVDLYTVKTLLGHSTLAMTERYSHLSQGTLQEAVKRLELSIKESKQAEVVELAQKLQS